MRYLIIIIVLTIFMQVGVSQIAENNSPLIIQNPTYSKNVQSEVMLNRLDNVIQSTLMRCGFTRVRTLLGVPGLKPDQVHELQKLDIELQQILVDMFIDKNKDKKTVKNFEKIVARIKKLVEAKAIVIGSLHRNSHDPSKEYELTLHIINLTTLENIIPPKPLTFTTDEIEHPDISSSILENHLGELRFCKSFVVRNPQNKEAFEKKLEILVKLEIWIPNDPVVKREVRKIRMQRKTNKMYLEIKLKVLDELFNTRVQYATQLIDDTDLTQELPCIEWEPLLELLDTIILAYDELIPIAEPENQGKLKYARKKYQRKKVDFIECSELFNNQNIIER